MHIRLAQEGGIVGGRVELAAIDTAALPEAAAARLEQLVHDADFFALPARLAEPSPDVGADLGLTHHVEVVAGDRRHAVAFAGAAPDRLHALLQAVRRTRG